MPHLIHCGEVDTVRGSSVESLLELSGGPRLDEAQASLDGPLTALFVFNGAIDGLGRRLQLNEPRTGVYCLFTLKWRRDFFAKARRSSTKRSRAFFRSVACCSLMTTSDASTVSRPQS